MTTHRGLSRRSLLAAVGGLAALPMLSSCGSATGSTARLRTAFPVSGARESLDPHTSSLFVDQARAKALFDTLVAYADDMSVVPRLAESWEADPTGTRWRVRLRTARFHDGSPVTAEDVLYSYRRIADPATASPARWQFTDIDFAVSRARSERELELVLHRPNFEFPVAWGAPATEIVPAGTTDFSAPVGSGPFRFVSFSPGAPAVLRRFDDYWGGPAGIEELEFVPINDESARVAALLSGQVHYAHDVSANSAQTLQRESRVRVLTAEGGTMQALALKVDRPPFRDPRVLRAVQLGIDREQLVEVVLAGQGVVGNDLFGNGLEHYPRDLPPRRRDPEQARDLLRQAGAEGLFFELLTSAADPYFEPASGLLAQQLSDIGLRVSPRVRSAETYFSDINDAGVAAHTRTAALPVVSFLRQRLRSDTASGNYTHYRSAEFDALLDKALATADPQQRGRLLAEAQLLARDRSGLVVWGFSDWNVAVSSELTGLRAAPPNSLDWARFDGVGFA